jgi:DNA-binding PucR family transcriptional regulator
MTAAVLDEIPEYASFTAPEPRQLIFDHSLDHVRVVAQAIQRWSLPSSADLAFIRQRVSLRAMQQLPLSAFLHGYRIGHRTVWGHLVRLLEGSEDILEASLALTALTLAYTELISGTVAVAYSEAQRDQMLQVDRDRRDLLERILMGTFDRQSDAARLASSFALVPGGDYVVVLVMPAAEPLAATGGESLGRMAETLRRHFALGIAQPFVVIRHAEVVSIAPLARVRASALAHLTRQSVAEMQQCGVPWNAGISTVCAGLGEVARGYQEARIAADLAPDRGGVCALLEARVSDFLLERADETALRMVPDAARQLARSPKVEDRSLVETLLAYADNELSVAATGEALSIHPNTVSYRLRKLGQRLGRDVSRFSDVVEVLAWFRVLEHAPPDA